MGRAQIEPQSSSVVEALTCRGCLASVPGEATPELSSHLSNSCRSIVSGEPIGLTMDSGDVICAITVEKTKNLSMRALHAVTLLLTTVTAMSDKFQTVFSKEEVRECVRIRTPSVMYNSDSQAIHVVARCCGKNECSSKTVSPLGNKPGLNDNDKDAIVVMKSTFDMGKTWHNFQKLSGTSFANGAGIYDR